MAAERTLRLTFSYDAWEWWEHVVNELGTLFVRVSPVGGGKPFDAYLVKVDDETDDVHHIRIIRGDHPEGPIETVAVEKIRIY